MKKIILTILIASIFVSCKKELPSNIKSAVIGCEMSYKIHRKMDSIILNHTKEEIDKMPLDTITKLIGDLEFNRNDEESNEKELKELLKINPEYSDYDEVKNMKKSYYDQNFLKCSKIEMYLNDKQFELMKKQYEK
jgi:hypothetical protein